jgi:hypothetical protein
MSADALPRNIDDSFHILRNCRAKVRQQIDRIHHWMDSSITPENRHTFQQETIKQLNSILSGIDSLKRSTTHYHFFYSNSADSGHGYTTANVWGDIEVVYGLKSDSDEVIGHEIIHAIQFERGQVSIAKKKKDDKKDLDGSLYDLHDEGEAYRSARIIIRPDVTMNDRFTDEYVADKFPEYQRLSREDRKLKSIWGEQLRKRTTDSGVGNRSNEEFYKGWEMDYLNGCNQRSDSGKVNGPCTIVRKRQDSLVASLLHNR